MRKVWMAVAALSLCGLIGLQSQAANNQKGKTKRTKSLTGCLRQGESTNEYTITGADGSTWEVEGDSSVSLAPHVGHTVTITGAISHPKMHAMKEKTKTEMKEHGMKKSDREHGHLMATNVTMVSETCK
jgi:hypothetical protein